MSRWSWLALVIVIAAGAVSLVYSYRLQTHHLPGLTPPDVQPSLLALSAVPTGLFLVALLVRRRSAWLPPAVAVAAGLVAALRVSVILYELGMEWTHGTGLFAGIAWAVGTGVASVFVVVAIIGIVVETLRGQPSV